MFNTMQQAVTLIRSNCTKSRAVLVLVCFVILSVLLMAGQKTKTMKVGKVDKVDNVIDYSNVINDHGRSPAIASYDNLTDDEARVIAAARQIIQKTGLLMISFINNAYVPFAYSWLCNTKYMDIHKHLLIIASDNSTLWTLRRHKPNIHSVSIKGFTMQGNQVYTRVGYVRIGIRRTIVLNWILQAGFGIFLIEFDCLWVRNPFPEMLKYSEYDLAILPVHKKQQNLVAIGFYYMFPTERMKQLWNELCRRLTILDNSIASMDAGKVIPEKDNDQRYLITLVLEKYADARVKILSLDQFPDGTWYKSNSPNKQNITNLFIINNNFIQGNVNKMNRAKQYGHWFTKKDGVTCDENAISNMVRY